jgi:DNA invertase Pin-like site-specific DNA recombinase
VTKRPSRSARGALAVDGYIRVSTIRGRRGERFISPDVQRDRITEWARATGTERLEVHEELNESGGRVDRPELAKAIEAGLSGTAICRDF